MEVALPANAGGARRQGLRGEDIAAVMFAYGKFISDKSQLYQLSWAS
ncbi:hypothetical protein [Sphingomonas prati]|nr:hypothetical protein [Sphingomonas prati]